LEDYVDSYYFVSKFKVVYEGWVEPMTDKTQWPKVDLGFKLWPPVLKRAAGRPRTRRIKAADEGGTRKKKKCKRCGQLGHMQKTCNETVYDSDDQPPAQPKPKSKKIKKKKKEVITEEATTSTPKRKRNNKMDLVAAQTKTSTPKRKRTKKNSEAPPIDVTASTSTPFRLQLTLSSSIDLKSSPGALTRR
jgi:uncharacterized C2H2 Zn-finger protein